MTTTTDSSSAPALERGLLILETLQASGPLSLEALAARSEIPKSSLLRLLDTLISRNYLERRSHDKCYQSLVSLVPHNTQTHHHEEIIQRALASLSEDLGLTTEWYRPLPEYALLTQRSESQVATVQIRASIGYQRSWWEELDAVARIGHAALKLPTTPQQQKSCRFYKNGVLMPYTTSSFKTAIRLISLDSPSFDSEYNANGIRRMAKAVLDPNGNLLGILAVPMHFQPDAEARLPERLRSLQQCSLHLQTQLQLPQ